MKGNLKNEKLFQAAVLRIFFPIAVLAADNGIISKPSNYPVRETLDRLEAVVKDRGITVFVRIDFSGDAEKEGLKMRPKQLLIFGNPKTGTALLNSTPSVAIDLPLKALAWEDESGKVWLSYNSPGYMKQRHELNDEFMKNIAAIGTFVDAALE